MSIVLTLFVGPAALSCMLRAAQAGGWSLWKCRRAARSGAAIAACCHGRLYRAGAQDGRQHASGRRGLRSEDHGLVSHRARLIPLRTPCNRRLIGSSAKRALPYGSVPMLCLHHVMQYAQCLSWASGPRAAPLQRWSDTALHESFHDRCHGCRTLRWSLAVCQCARMLICGAQRVAADGMMPTPGSFEHKLMLRRLAQGSRGPQERACPRSRRAAKGSVLRHSCTLLIAGRRRCLHADVVLLL